MDRMYMAPHRVAVYDSQADKTAGRTHRIENLVPYPHQGYDNYVVDGVMYPGFLDSARLGVDACVVLTNPMFPRRAK